MSPPRLSHGVAGVQLASLWALLAAVEYIVALVAFAQWRFAGRDLQLR